MSRIVDQCEECIRRTGLECPVFQHPEKVWRKDSCRAFATDIPSVLALEKERRDHLISRGFDKDDVLKSAITIGI